MNTHHLPLVHRADAGTALARVEIARRALRLPQRRARSLIVVGLLLLVTVVLGAERVKRVGAHGEDGEREEKGPLAHHEDPDHAAVVRAPVPPLVAVEAHVEQPEAHRHAGEGDGGEEALPGEARDAHRGEDGVEAIGGDKKEHGADNNEDHDEAEAARCPVVVELQGEGEDAAYIGEDVKKVQQDLQAEEHKALLGLGDLGHGWLWEQTERTKSKKCFDFFFLLFYLFFFSCYRLACLSGLLLELEELRALSFENTFKVN